MIGLDISDKMVQLARAKNLYTSVMQVCPLLIVTKKTICNLIRNDAITFVMIMMMMFIMIMMMMMSRLT